MRKFLFLLVLGIGCTSIYKTDLSHLKNNSPLKSAHYQSLPRQSVTISIEGLPNRVPLEAQGLFSIMENILEKGPQGMPEKVYRKKLFLMNASISFSTQYRTSYLTVTAPKKYLSSALELALKTFKNPKFDDKEVNKAIRQTKANVTASFAEMRNVILYYGFKDYFDFDPMVRNGSTSPYGMKQIKAGEVKKLYNEFFQLEPLRFYTAGPMDEKEVANILNRELKEITDEPYSPYPFEKRKQAGLDKIQVTLIHRNNVTDHQVLFVYPFSINPASQKGMNATVMFEILGGGLTGHLGRTLREERGLTYHASADFGRYLPVWYIYSFAGNQQIEGLLKGVVEVKENFRKKPVEKDEIMLAKQSLITSHKRSTELPMDTLYAEMYYDLFDYNLDYLYNYEEKLQNVNSQSLNQLKKEVLKQDKFHLYLMGDKSVLLPVLRKIGWDKVVEIVEEKEI